MFTVEYDVAQHESLERSGATGSGCGGPILVEIRRDVGDIVGFGLNVDPSSGHVFVESIKQVGIKKNVSSFIYYLLPPLYSGQSCRPLRCHRSRRPLAQCERLGCRKVSLINKLRAA